MSPAVKRAADLAARLLVMPAWCLYRLQSILVGSDYGFVAVTQRAARWPGLGGIYLRRHLLRRIGVDLGEEVVIGFGSTFTRPPLRLGNRVYIGPNCVLSDVTIGDNTMLADGVSVLSGPTPHGTDRLDVPMRDQPGSLRPVTIGTDVWIGSRAVVLADVGDHCVVGAGSVVTRAVPPFQVVVGNPARLLRDRRAGDAAASSDTPQWTGR